MNSFLIDYQDIQAPKKGFSKLFKDYTREGELHEQLTSKFFHFDYRKEADYYKHLNILLSRKYRRKELVELLVRQNREFGTAEKHVTSIERLGSNHCMLVVTGQQPGLFTGPLYSVYKALTAVMVAERQKEMFPEYDFLPLFWIEGEDHDFNESAKASVFQAGRPVHVTLDAWNRLPDRMLSRTVLGPGITETVSAFISLLQDSDYKEEISSALRNFYTPESTLELAFGRTMAFLFREYPLLFLSPSDPYFKKLAKDAFHHELATCPHSSHSVIEQSSLLESMGYQAQAKPRAVNLFYLNHQDQRMKIEQPSADTFTIVPEKYRYSKHQMLELCDDHPEQFSPNVVLRPVVQDHALPVFAYIAGPGEISYLAQYRRVYEHFGLRMPFIIPRGSFTLIEPTVSRIMDKVLQKTGRPSLSRKQIYHTAFHNLRVLQKNAISGAEDSDFDAALHRAEKNILAELQTLSPTLAKLDRNLEQVLAGSVRQVEKIMEGVRQKTHRTSRKKHDELVAQLEKAATALFPEDIPQERVINIFYYINKYGWSILEDFARMLRAHATESHMILEL
ncbi:MAG: bacillithiol biosynthesis cysteine-adding enzyme BshC [Chlorobiales bacterium]|nr:bacillithiol biosynthesis cysteine-adding enzyme BshC [Chlorobiales bacterium]